MEGIVGMPEKRTAPLGAVEETLLIPLYARALETRKKRPVVSDPHAVVMVDQIDYDFARLGTGPSMIGSVLRGMIIDSWVARFLADHPGGTVVEIGVGLNTRYERMDNGRAQWVEFDLPEVHELRSGFFEETERRTMLAASAADESWVSTVRDRPAPYLFVSEAVLIYLTLADAVATIGRIRRDFPDSEVLMDSFASAGLDSLDTHDTLRQMSARPGWAVDNAAKDFADWDVGISVRETCQVTGPPIEVRRRLPWRLRLVLALVDRTAKAGHYRMHRLHVAPPTGR